MTAISKILLIHGLLLISLVGSSQTTKELTLDDGLLSHHYSESKNGKKDGAYQLYYKHQLIEQGQYQSGTKVGKWQYFSFNNILEYEYDFDNQMITRIGGEGITEEVRFNTPCFFEGSPLIPYLFMVSNVYYPKGAVEKDLSGRVVLTLKIDKKGKVYGYYISEKLNYVLDKAVMDAASKMPDDWKFLPATRNGHPLTSEYTIPIEFELYP